MMDTERLQHLVEANEHLVLAVLQAHAQRALDERKIEDLARAVSCDPLTGLPTRTILQDRLPHAVIQAKRSGHRLALLFVDLNRFKHINDTLGHTAGDQALQAAAQCMTNAVRESDTVTRYGGDEFVILLEDISNRSDVTAVIEKMLSSLAAANRVGTHDICLTASVGVSMYPDDGHDAETLLALADAAMYRVKRGGHGRYAFAGTDAGQAGDAGSPVAKPHLAPPETKEQRHRYRRATDEQMIEGVLTTHELQVAAEQALRRQTEFMAILAHELRNPLTPILNAALLLRQTPPDAATAFKIHSIVNRQVMHMTKLLDDVFDMSRIATGKMRVQCERIDIVDAIRQAIDIVQASIDTRRQTLRLAIPDFAVEMSGDPVRLVQIFANLLDNASKYSPPDAPITLTLESDHASVSVRITDTGIGITAETLPNVFQMFAQDTHATRFNGHGLGIGLALVKELVEAHCGTVTAHSDSPGCGSVFAVVLPRGLAASDA